MLPDMTSWTDSEVEAILSDQQLWEPYVRGIAKREGLSYQKLEAGFPASSAVFLLDGRYALKIFPPKRGVDADVEASILECLAESRLVPAPRLHARGVLREQTDWIYLLMDCVPGVAARDLLSVLRPEDIAGISEELADIVQALHCLAEPLREPLWRAHRGWEHTAAALRRDRDQALVALGQPEHCEDLSPGLLEEIADALQTEAEWLVDGEPALVNGDLTEDHLYLAEESGRWVVSGLIDFADTLIGPHELDWHDLRFCLFASRPEPMKIFLRRYYHGSVALESLRRTCLLGLTGEHVVQELLLQPPRSQRQDIRSLADLQEHLWPNAMWGVE